MSGIQLVNASDMGAAYADNIAPIIKNNSREKRLSRFFI